MFGTNTPIWMTEPGPVYVRKHVRDKYHPVVEEINLFHANQNTPSYGHSKVPKLLFLLEILNLFQVVQKKQISPRVFCKVTKFRFLNEKERTEVRMILLEQMIRIINLICKLH